MQKLFSQILRFSIIGGSTTLIDFLILIFATETLGIPYFISNIFSFTVSLVVNYFLSIRYVFEIKNNHTRSKNTIIFFVLSMMGLCLNQVILVLLTNCFGVFYVISKIIAVFIVMAWNFISKKMYFEYKKAKNKSIKET